MKYSRAWLQEHLEGTLPSNEELIKEVTLKAFEVEETLGFGEESVFEIKVLPDRAHDALSHRGMARELGALFSLSRKAREVREISPDVS
ncbi:MAG: hypothetical protein AAB545_01660, partial [Patescibacteria group bacterium]